MLSPVEEIKSRLDIVEVISQYVKLQKAGANYKAPCPFHSEKKGSFFVSPAKQIWHCFGCQKGGDIFSFVKEIEGVEFGDALRILAQKANIELKKETPLAKELKSERARFYEICLLAENFFEKQLEATKSGQEVYEYLFKRGISQESIKEWKIGYAPDSWHGLTNFLSGRGFKNSEIEKSGLAIKSEIGSIHDRFRGRIMFPICDFNGQPVGFGGRIFKSKREDDAKYINTPNTILYDKSRILYGLDKAKIDIRKKDSCILVEGYTDVIMSFQAGIKNTVSASGTALTPFQLNIIKRYTENLILGYDMDVAGESATKRGIDLAQSQGFNIRVVRVQGGKDPADVIADNADAWINAVENSKSILDFYFENAFSKHSHKTPEGKKALSKILLPSIKRVANQIEKTFWIQKLAQGLEAREEDVREELKKTKIDENPFTGIESGKVVPAVKKSRAELLEERLIVILIKFPDKSELVGDDLLPFFSQIKKEILTFLKKGEGDEKKNLEGEAKDHYNLLCLRSEMETISSQDAENEIRFILREIKKIQIKENLEQISRRIKNAEIQKSGEDLKKLTEEYSLLCQKIQSLEECDKN